MEPQETTLEKLWTTGKEMLGALCDELASAKVLGMTHSEVEQVIDCDGKKILRSLFQDHLTLRSLLEERPPEPVVGSDGADRTHVRRHRRGLETLFGAVEVVRMGHGQRRVESLHPLDARLNLPPDLYSFGVRRRVALAASCVSFDAVVATIKATTGADVPKRQVEQLARRAATDFVAFYEARPETPNKPGALLVLSLDGKGIVMRACDLKAATRKKAQAQRRILKKRLRPGEKRNAKRIATVAAVYTIERHVRTPEEVARPPKKEERTPAPRPIGKRVWASIERPMEDVITEMFDEAFRQDPNGQKVWVCLTDGNPTQIRHMKERAAAIGVKLVIVLDIIHVLEYLWKAATAFHKASTPEAEEWVTERLLHILQGRSSNVAAGMRQAATKRGLSKQARAAVDKCAGYLLKLRDYLRYDEYLRLGLPIATGVIEGACRHLIKDRMDVTGARWSLAGAEAVLKLRALVSSGDFDAYWTFHEAREMERNHANLYADNVIPFTRPAGRVREVLRQCAA